MKYMGSKNRLAKELLPIILRDRLPNQYYVEPFMGGCNMIDKVTGLRIGGELNRYVTALFIELQNGWIPPVSVTESEWLDVKNNKDKYPDHFVAFCGLCLTFGSVWFCAYARDKEGKRNYAKEAFNNLSKQAPKLKGIEFHCSDYQQLSIPPNSIIYCDPPYEGTDKYRGFEQIDHSKFWQWCREKKAEGHQIFISEFKAPDDFICVWEKTVTSGIAEKNKKALTEKLFTL